jgi:DNA-binding NtrC family response regulator
METAILLVDDEAAIRELFAVLLEPYTVVKAPDAATALTLLASRPFHLVITDYLMPGMPGDQLIREICARFARTQTVLMSAHADLATLASACGADDYYLKGEPLDGLLTKVEALLLQPAGDHSQT